MGTPGEENLPPTAPMGNPGEIGAEEPQTLLPGVEAVTGLGVGSNRRTQPPPGIIDPGYLRVGTPVPTGEGARYMASRGEDSAIPIAESNIQNFLVGGINLIDTGHSEESAGQPAGSNFFPTLMPSVDQVGFVGAKNSFVVEGQGDDGSAGNPTVPPSYPQCEKAKENVASTEFHLLES